MLGEMGEGNKKIKTRNCLNFKNLIGIDPSIFCHACENWTNGHCAKVSEERIELLQQREGTMWFCDKCRCHAKNSLRRGLTEFKAEIDQKTTAFRDLAKQTIAKNDEMTEKLVQEGHEAAKRTDKPKEQAQTNTSGSTQARAPGQKGHTLQTGSKKDVTPQRNLEHILIASSTFNFRDTIQIKKDFAKFFPLKRLIHAFITTRGNVRLEFVSKEEADEVF